MAVNYAMITNNQAQLSTDFGEQLAIKKTGFDLETLQKLMGVYVRGPKKGRLKGQITWWKVTRPGWVRAGIRGDDDHANGFVVKTTFCFGFGLSNSNFDTRKLDWRWGAHPDDNEVRHLSSHLYDQRKQMEMKEVAYETN